LYFQDTSIDPALLCDELQRIITEQQSALEENRLAEFSRLSVAFHESMINACPNATLRAFALNTQVKLDLFVLSYQESPEMRRKSISDHTRILDCLRVRDLNGFRAALHEHNTSPIRFFETLQANSDPT
ncbi:MAG: FCD domain-containing protein, partial [Mogibacterium sp.]|nr:FCD domain-containing protein [Mogibacterium sp.]